MDHKLVISLLVSEILLLKEELESRGASLSEIPAAEDLLNVPESDLNRLKKDLRDMVRTLGGAR